MATSHLTPHGESRASTNTTTTRRAILSGAAAGMAIMATTGAAAIASPGADDPDAHLVALWRELESAQAEWASIHAEMKRRRDALPDWTQGYYNPKFDETEAEALSILPNVEYGLEDMTASPFDMADLPDGRGLALAKRFDAKLKEGKGVAKLVWSGAKVRAAADAERQARAEAWYAKKAEMDWLHEEAGLNALWDRWNDLDDRMAKLGDEIEQRPAAGYLGLLVKARNLQRWVREVGRQPNGAAMLSVVLGLQRLAGVTVPPVADRPDDDPASWDIAFVPDEDEEE